MSKLSPSIEYGTTKTVVEALEIATGHASALLAAEMQGLLDELKTGTKILDPWEIEDVYANWHGDQDLTEEQAIEVLAAFDDRDKSSDGDEISDIAYGLFSELYDNDGTPTGETSE